MNKQQKRAGLIFIGLILILASAWLLGFSVEPGIGLASDSYYYVSGADTLFNGDGFGRIAGDGEFKPTTHFPPIYSFALLMTRLASGERIDAVPVLHQALLMGVLTLGFLLVTHLTDSTAAGVIFILLAGLAPAMLSVFSWLLSEGMFLLVVAATLTIMAGYERQHSSRWLAVAGLLTGLAYLTRYTGVTLAAAIGLALLLTEDIGRWRKSALYLGTSALLPIIWLLRNWFIAGVTTNRSLGWHPISLEKIRSGMSVLAGWISPGQVPDFIRLGMLILLVGALLLGYFLAWRRNRKLGIVEASLLAFFLIYPTFLVLSISIVDAATPLDERILSPLFATILILSINLFCMGWHRFNWPGWIKASLAIGMVLFAGLTVVRGVRQAMDLHLDGQGFASARWSQSAMIDWLNGLPPDTILYSNELDAIYLLTGRLVYQIPIKWDPVRDQPRTDYDDQLEAMRLRLEAEDGYLVTFETLSNQQAFFPPEAELSQGMESVLVVPLGAVYRFP